MQLCCCVASSLAFSFLARAFASSLHLSLEEGVLVLRAFCHFVSLTSLTFDRELSRSRKGGEKQKQSWLDFVARLDKKGGVIIIFQELLQPRSLKHHKPPRADKSEIVLETNEPIMVFFEARTFFHRWLSLFSINCFWRH